MDTITENTDAWRQMWVKLPEPFCFYRLVLNSDHLHFGLWPDDAPDSDLEKAQDIWGNLYRTPEPHTVQPRVR